MFWHRSRNYAFRVQKFKVRTFTIIIFLQFISSPPTISLPLWQLSYISKTINCSFKILFMLQLHIQSFSSKTDAAYNYTQPADCPAQPCLELARIRRRQTLYSASLHVLRGADLLCHNLEFLTCSKLMGSLQKKLEHQGLFSIIFLTAPNKMSQYINLVRREKTYGGVLLTFFPVDRLQTLNADTKQLLLSLTTGLLTGFYKIELYIC